MKKITLLTIAVILMAGLLGINASASTMSQDEMANIMGKGGKGSGGSNGGYTPYDPDGLTASQFYNKYANNTVYFWEGKRYQANGNGNYGIDGAGTVVETLYAMGYDTPVTTADGLYYNFYKSNGFDYSFFYTKSSGISDYDMLVGNFYKMSKGDLVFLDYNFDYEYDHVATYLGYYQGISNAVLTASDYWGQVVIADMNDVMDPFCQDLMWSNVSTKKIDYFNVEKYF